MAADSTVIAIAPGTFVALVGDRRELIYVAGSSTNRWAFWNGHVFRSRADASVDATRDATSRPGIAQPLTAPMPATVIRVLATPTTVVRKGETLVILEAMKMELPIRAFNDGVVKAVHCREGDLVQADQLLVEME